MIHRLALGTAQFGMAYGIANATGKVSGDEVGEILRCARRAGVETLDTAAGYGTSEQVLGENGVKEWKVVSKLPALPDHKVDVKAWVHEAVDTALSRLRIPFFHGLLVHRLDDLLGPRRGDLVRGLQEVREAGKAMKIGASVYGPEPLEALDYIGRFDLVQAPLNVIDRRLSSSGWLSRLAAGGVEVHVRSAFMQGLLLLPAESRPARFRRWQALWRAWDDWIGAESLTPLQACLAFALSHEEVDRVVVGVDSARQLQEIFAACKPMTLTPPMELVSEDPDLVDPSNWAIQ